MSAIPLGEKSIAFGDILQAETGIIVHGCNARGVMGSGVAALIANKYPGAYRLYRRELAKERRTKDALGKVYFYRVNEELTIANAITQLDYGRDPTVRYVNYEAVHDAFETVALYAGNSMIHYPMIGAGLGNGDWGVLSTIIDWRLRDHYHKLWIQP